MDGIRNKPLDTEYYLLVKNKDNGMLYNDWFKVDELIKLPGCTIGRECLLDRIRKRQHLFKTLEEAVFTPSKNGNNEISQKKFKARIEGKSKNKAYYTECEFYNLDKIWKPGSMCNKYRIMGSIAL